MEYIHGGDIYRHPVDFDFSVNINPLGMPERSRRAGIKAMASVEKYPDYEGEALCQAIASFEGVKKEQVLLGNGGAELIYTLCYALRPKKGLLTLPSFGEYERALQAAGAECTFWQRKREEGFCLKEDFLKAVEEDISVLFLCNPNNPTGSRMEKELLLEIARACERTKTCFCVDECFLPFLQEESQLTLKRELEQFPHLIVLRAFTKIYGMPGLRLGYVLSANKPLLEKMERAMQPWNTSLPAQMAGIKALEDKAYIERTRELIEGERRWLIKELSRGLTEKIYPSSANFIFFRAREDLKERLLEKGILIRSCENYRGLEKGYFRIGIRKRAENKELIQRWRELY